MAFTASFPGDCSAVITVFVRMMLASFVGVLACMRGMSVGDVRVMRRLLMVTGFMMFGRLVVMFRRVLMMLCCFAVVFSCFVWHRLISWIFDYVRQQYA